MIEPTVFVLKSRLSELGRVGQTVESFGAQHGLTAKTISQLRLALEETLSDSMSYAYEGRRGKDRGSTLGRFRRC